MSDLTPLASLSGLRGLDLECCVRVTYLQPLAGCRALQRLSVRGCQGVSGVAPLYSLPALQLLDMGGCPQLERDLLPSRLLAAVELGESIGSDSWEFWNVLLWAVPSQVQVGLL